jgi:hypothetical protein
MVGRLNSRRVQEAPTPWTRFHLCGGHGLLLNEFPRQEAHFCVDRPLIRGGPLPQGVMELRLHAHPQEPGRGPRMVSAYAGRRPNRVRARLRIMPLTI